MLHPVQFIGYQESEHFDPFALFNVTDPHHRLFGSTVSLHTILYENLTPCTYPPFEEWKRTQLVNK